VVSDHDIDRETDRQIVTVTDVIIIFTNMNNNKSNSQITGCMKILLIEFIYNSKNKRSKRKQKRKEKEKKFNYPRFQNCSV